MGCIYLTGKIDMTIDQQQSYQALLAQREELEKKIESARKQELSGAIQQIKSLMAQYDISVDDLGAKFSAGRSNPTKGSKIGRAHV